MSTKSLKEKEAVQEDVWFREKVFEIHNLVQKIFRPSQFRKMLDNYLPNCDKHEQLNEIKFCLEGNEELQEIISYCAVNNMVTALTREGDPEQVKKAMNLFYKWDVENQLRLIFIKDMRVGEFKYLPIIMDLVAVPVIKRISFNREPYKNIISRVKESTRELESSLLARELDMCF